MRKNLPIAPSVEVSPSAYGPEYYGPGDEVYPHFAFDPDRDIPQARAIADAVGL